MSFSKINFINQKNNKKDLFKTDRIELFLSKNIIKDASFSFVSPGITIYL